METGRVVLTRRRFGQLGTMAVAAGRGGTALQAVVDPNGPIRVGVLHSLSGDTAITETPLKDAVLMLVAEQNRKGGLLGRTLVPVVTDPASNPATFTERARALLTDEHCAVVFGCWTSAARRAVLPVFEEQIGILFYPAPHAGQECSHNIIYTGAVPNQQAIPAADYLLGAQQARRFVLLGDAAAPPYRMTQILAAYLKGKGMADADLLVTDTAQKPDWAKIVGQIKQFGGGTAKTAVLALLAGSGNTGFYKEVAAQGVKASDIPIMALGATEHEFAGLDTAALEGHLAAWGFFAGTETEYGRAFADRWHDFLGNRAGPVTDPIEAHANGFALWMRAVQAAGSPDRATVLDALIGQAAQNFSGELVALMPDHHLTHPVMIGALRRDGHFNVVSRSNGPIVARPWSAYLAETRDLIGDWRAPMNCGAYNIRTGKCGGS